MEQLCTGVARELGLSDDCASTRPIRVIQFGEGNFLRAFVDWAIQRMNTCGQFDGNVVIVQPLPEGRIRELERQNRLYTVLLEGIKDGKRVRSREVVDSIGATVDVYTDWQGYLALADNPDTRIIVSNTTEAGIAISDEDAPDQCPPKSFPAKLVHLLKRRYDAQLPGFLIIPCELIADNGDALRDCLIRTARRFGWDDDFIAWIDRENTFVCTLVDRIVPGFPRDDAEALWNELGYRDENMVKAEPFFQWVIAGDSDARRRVRELLSTDGTGVDITVCGDVRPYRQRKVFLLNGPHTTMALVARLTGLNTVGAVMADDMMRSFIEREMREEIVPVLTLPVQELDSFVAAVLERFANPFVEHALDSIALNSVAKFRARLLPVLHQHVACGRGVPKRIVLALAALIAEYAGMTDTPVSIVDDDDAVRRLSQVTGDRSSVCDVLRDSNLWGEDLTLIEGVCDVVVDNVAAIARGDIMRLISELA